MRETDSRDSGNSGQRDQKLTAKALAFAERDCRWREVADRAAYDDFHRRVRAPLLLLSGGDSALIQRLIDPELLHTVSHAARVVIDDATHELCVEQPGGCAEAIDAFIVKNGV